MIGIYYPKRGNFQVGKSYLIKSSVGSTVQKIKVLAITETSLQIQYENGYKHWTTKEDFDYDYRLLEELQN